MLTPSVWHRCDAILVLNFFFFFVGVGGRHCGEAVASLNLNHSHSRRDGMHNVAARTQTFSHILLRFALTTGVIGAGGFHRCTRATWGRCVGASSAASGASVVAHRAHTSAVLYRR